MPRGGARPGAGRKKGSKVLDKEMARERLRMKVWAQWDPLIDAQIEKAKGVKYIVARDAKGGKFRPISEAELENYDPEKTIVEVWEKPPDTPAFVDLMNRAIDKPKEQPQEVDLTLRNVDDLVGRINAGRERVKGK